MCNLADLLLEQVLLDSYYVDSQWAAPTAAGDSASSDADNLDAEVEAIKYFIERLVSSYPLFLLLHLALKLNRSFDINRRDVSVQKKFENPSNQHILWMLLEFLANGNYSCFVVVVDLHF